MKDPIFILKGEKVTVSNIMGFVSRLREYQENHTSNATQVIHFYEKIREQIYFNEAIEREAKYLLFDFVNSEITRGFFKKFNVKPLTKFVLRVNPLFDRQQLSNILYKELLKEKWIECDEATFTRIFIESDKELFPINFIGSINDLIQVFKSLCKEKRLPIIQEKYKSLICQYFINEKGKPYKLGSIKSLNVRYSAKPDAHTEDVVASILKQVFSLLKK